MFSKSRRVFGMMLDGVDEGLANVLATKKTEVVLAVASTAIVCGFVHWQWKEIHIVVSENTIVSP